MAILKIVILNEKCALCSDFNLMDMAWVIQRLFSNCVLAILRFRRLTVVQVCRGLIFSADSPNFLRYFQICVYVFLVHLFLKWFGQRCQHFFTNVLFWLVWCRYVIKKEYPEKISVVKELELHVRSNGYLYSFRTDLTIHNLNFFLQNQRQI